jgi:hypothetical protein
VLGGAVAAAGVRRTTESTRLEIGVTGERFDRRVETDPAVGPFLLDEPRSSGTRDVRSAAVFGRAELAPLGLGVLGTLGLEGSGFVSSAKGGRAALDPARTGRVSLRLRRDFFDRHFRLEGELTGSAHSTMSSTLGTIPAQELLSARAAARVLDIVIFYRSENILRKRVLSAAFDESTGFAPLTGQNITVGLSWVLLD